MKQEKCCFCEKPDAPALMVSGFSKKLKPRLACTPCALNYQNLRFHFGRWTPIQSTKPAIDTNSLTHEGREKLKANLANCACGHPAKRHTQDAQDNLLQCKECDCARFWYSVPQHRNTALIVLADAIQQSPAMDKIAKLREITRENGATAEEEATALRRILDLTMKEAA